MNISSLSKLSLVAAAIIVVSGGAQPQRAFGSNTGTLPVISGPRTNSMVKGTKDNGSLPIIANPSNPNPTGDGGSGCYGGETYTITVTISDQTTNDQPITLTSSNSELVSVDSSAVVTAGSTTVTANYYVPYSHYGHHKDVTLTASCNGSSVSTVIHVHYNHEQG